MNDDWLKKLLAAVAPKITGDQGMVPGGTPPFVPRPDGMPGAVAGQPPLKNSFPATQATVPIGSAAAPVVTQPPNGLSTSPPATTSANISTPEQQLAAKLGEYETVANRDPKLKHNLKNNLLQGLFLGLQGVQRLADPERAPQGPLQWLGQARKQDELQRMVPGIQGLQAEVGARQQAAKAGLEEQNIKSQIAAREQDMQIKDLKRKNPGMEIKNDPSTGNLIWHKAGSDDPFVPVPGSTPAQMVPITSPDGTTTVQVPAKDALHSWQQEQEAANNRAFQEGTINQKQRDENNKRLDDWRQTEDARLTQVAAWTTDARAKSNLAFAKRQRAEKMPDTKEAFDLNKEADELEAEATRLSDLAATSRPTKKPTLTEAFQAPAGTATGGKITKAALLARIDARTDLTPAQKAQAKQAVNQNSNYK